MKNKLIFGYKKAIIIGVISLFLLSGFTNVTASNSMLIKSDEKNLQKDEIENTVDSQIKEDFTLAYLFTMVFIRGTISKYYRNEIGQLVFKCIDVTVRGVELGFKIPNPIPAYRYPYSGSIYYDEFIVFNPGAEFKFGEIPENGGGGDINGLIFHSGFSK